MAAPRLATAVAAARALKCSGPAAGARAWEPNRTEIPGYDVFCATAFLLSSPDRDATDGEMEIIQAAQRHYEQICAIETASYPADEAASPEGIAVGCTSVCVRARCGHGISLIEPDPNMSTKWAGAEEASLLLAAADTDEDGYLTFEQLYDLLGSLKS